jgi:general secretion pathway protein N
MSRFFSWTGLALLLALSAAVTIALRAPAAWLGDWLQTHGKFRLLDARGTVWQGSALLGISNGRETTLIPGRIEWTVDALAPTRIAARVSHQWLGAPLALSVANDGMQIARGSARLPAGVLAGTGAPFNTLRPGGLLEVSWTDSRIRGGVLTGEVQVDWRDAQSALSTVAPLGTYRLNARNGHNGRFPDTFQRDSDGGTGDAGGPQRAARAPRHAVGRQGVVSHRHLVERKETQCPIKG